MEQPVFEYSSTNFSYSLHTIGQTSLKTPYSYRRNVLRKCYIAPRFQKDIVNELEEPVAEFLEPIPQTPNITVHNPADLVSESLQPLANQPPILFCQEKLKSDKTLFRLGGFSLDSGLCEVHYKPQVCSLHLFGVRCRYPQFITIAISCLHVDKPLDLSIVILCRIPHPPTPIMLEGPVPPPLLPIPPAPPPPPLLPPASNVSLVYQLMLSEQAEYRSTHKQCTHYFALRLSRYAPQSSTLAYLCTPLAALGVIPQSNTSSSTGEIGCCGCALRLMRAPSLGSATLTESAAFGAGHEARARAGAEVRGELIDRADLQVLMSGTNHLVPIPTNKQTLQSNFTLVSTFTMGSHHANCTYKRSQIRMEKPNEQGIGNGC